jgi:hypothetical protein
MYSSCRICKKIVACDGEGGKLGVAEFKKNYCTCKWRRFLFEMYEYLLAYDRYGNEDIEMIIAIEEKRKFKLKD